MKVYSAVIERCP